MAHSIAFDTLAFAKKLEASGISTKQSEAIAEAVADVFDNNTSATKQDLLVLKAELKADLIKWIVGLLFAQTTIILSIMAILKFV